MGYRELSRMEIVEVVRRWQLGESQRAIARASGVARETVKKYLRAAEELGVAANGLAVDENLDRAHIAGEIASVSVRFGQGGRRNPGVVLGSRRGAVAKPRLELKERH